MTQARSKPEEYSGMPYFFFPRRAAAYRIAQQIIEEIEGESGTPISGREIKRTLLSTSKRPQAIKAEASEVPPEAASELQAEAQKRVSGTSIPKKTKVLAEKDPRLFDMVLEELGKDATA